MPENTRTIKLPGGVTLDLAELRFAHSRAPGPGGQNVNKVNSRVTLLYDVMESAALSAYQKRLIVETYPGRVNNLRVMRVVSSRFRTQAANRNAAIARFTELLTIALTPRKPRKRTKPSAAARVRRRDDKLRRSRQKQLRRPPGPNG